MEKTGLCSSGGKGSQSRIATAWQHSTNQSKPVGKVSTLPPQGTKIMYDNHMTNKMLLTDSAFIQALRDLPAFLLSTDADLDMAYDWVCEMSRPFAGDTAAFDLFYDVYNETFDA